MNKIERVSPKDINKIIEMSISRWPNCGKLINEIFIDNLIRRGPDYCLKSVENGKLVGTVLGSERSACFTESPSRNLYVNILLVDENYRQDGRGSALLNNMESSGRGNNLETSYLHVCEKDCKEGALVFYTKMGYEIDGLENLFGEKRLTLKKKLNSKLSISG